MSKDIVKDSIKCLANMEIKETTYQVARSVVLDEIERLNNIINELFEYLKENSKQPELFESDRYYEDILDKLQELKGSDKE